MRKMYTPLKGHFKPIMIVSLLFMQLFWIINPSMGSAIVQPRVLKGTVKDAASNESLIGVSVVIKGTVTNIDGEFTLEVNTNDILIFSFIGYIDEEVTIAGQAEISISMSPDLVGLDEVVVIGYGVQKKKLNTGASLNVKGEDIQK